MSDYTDVIMAVSTISGLHSPVSDTDGAIIVNIGTRDFSFESDFKKTIGVIGDHNSNIVSFKLPRYIDSHDISECAEYKVIWRSTNYEEDGHSGKSYIEDIKVLEDQSSVLLGWVITDDLTALACELEFALAISDYDSDGQLIYRWKTKYGRGIMIEDGPEDNYPETIKKSYFTMVDQENGDEYRLYVSGGHLMMESV